VKYLYFEIYYIGGFKMKVKVYRCEPNLEGSEHYDYFDVPVIFEEKWTVMNVLDYIQEHCDSSLSYYKHSTCGHGICGRCMLMVNGKPVLACTHIVRDKKEIVLEPFLKGKKSIKDLVVK
jgi:succinate dehydrogenase / fumarate reductase iron-sulfur subunit